MTMLVCMKCAREMRCTRNGTVLRWGVGHCYNGDTYTCPGCGAEITLVSPLTQPYHEENSKAPVILQMDGENAGVYTINIRKDD